MYFDPLLWLRPVVFRAILVLDLERLISDQGVHEGLGARRQVKVRYLLHGGVSLAVAAQRLVRDDVVLVEAVLPERDLQVAAVVVHGAGLDVGTRSVLQVPYGGLPLGVAAASTLAVAVRVVLGDAERGLLASFEGGPVSRRGLCSGRRFLPGQLLPRWISVAQ